MKKIISTILAGLMLLSALPVSASAATTGYGETAENSDATLSADAVETTKETQPTYPDEDSEFYGEKYYEVGELSDGYKLYYIRVFYPPWENEFGYTYGKYIFTNYGSEAERSHGFYVAKGALSSEKLMLSEAFEKGISDIETVVKLIKSRNDIEFTVGITSTDEVNAQLKERYNRDFNVVYLGSIWGSYRLYYNIPVTAPCEWELEFVYGDYMFRANCGQTSSVEPEALGLYVVGYGKVFNLEEALNASEIYNYTYRGAKLDAIVNLIKSKDLPYTFSVEYYVPPTSAVYTQPTSTVYTQPVSENPTETVEQPTVSMPYGDETIKEKFIRHLNVFFRDEITDNYLMDYADLGTIYTKTGAESRLIYGYHLEQPVEGSEIKLGEYTVWSPATDFLTGAGLYVYHDDMFEKLENVKDRFYVSEIINRLYDYPVRVFNITESNASALISERFGYGFSNLVKLGEVAEGYDLYFNIPGVVCTWVLEFTYGDYVFREGGGQAGSYGAEDLGLFIVGNGKAYNLTEAYEGKIVDIEKVVELIKANDLPYNFSVTKKTDEKTQPTEAPTNAALYKYRKHIADNMGYGKTAEDIEVDVFTKLSGSYYLVHYDHEVSTAAMTYCCIDKYLYVAGGSGYEAYIYDYKSNKDYKISTAYQKGLITKTDLKTISKALNKVEYVAKMYENVITLNAGERYGEFHLSSDIKGGAVKNSNSKVAKLVKDKYNLTDLAALTKGTTKFTKKLTNGQTITCKVVVKNNPKLTKNGKKITSVTVKKGSTVKVKISGKAKGVNNKYTSTKYAKITSKKTAATISIKGKKRGTTTLKITVNGKKLSLKVKVK